MSFLFRKKLWILEFFSLYILRSIPCVFYWLFALEVVVFVGSLVWQGWVSNPEQDEA